jgi:hypothetical protein
MIVIIMLTPTTVATGTTIATMYDPEEVLPPSRTFRIITIV